MTSNRLTHLRSLLERGERAEGPDRELDGQVLITVVGRSFLHVPFYTRDLDAAVSLIERALPGWFWRVGLGTSGEWLYGRYVNGWAFVQRAHSDSCDLADEAGGRAATPTLALLSALMKALIAREEQNEQG